MDIHILGTSHVSSVSVKNIEQAIQDIKPTVIAVELDEQRLHTLLSQKKPRLPLSAIRTLGVKGFLFAAFAMTTQQFVGKMLRMQPGSDMLTGVRLAKKHNIKLALIDQPINKTLQQLSKRMSFGDVVRFCYDSIYSIIRPRRFAQKYNLKPLSVNQPSPEAVTAAIHYLEVRFPDIYDVLVHQRNLYMAQKVLSMKSEETVLTIVGAGHVDGLHEMLHETRYNYTVSGADMDVA